MSSVKKCGELNSVVISYSTLTIYTNNHVIDHVLLYNLNLNVT
jgi:S1-C subfamily serine protease